MNKEKVFYLCDGEVENCKKTRCYKNGGVPGEPDTAMSIER